MTISESSLDSNINNLIKHYQKKDFKTAKSLAEVMTKQFPRNNFSWQILSLIFMSNGEINKAHQAIKNAVKIDPNDYKALNNLGIILFKLGLNEESILTFKKVLLINKDNLNSYINLGTVYQKMNNLKEAETNYLKAISINPNLPIIHNNLGNTLKDLNKIQEAETSYKKAIDLDSNYNKAKENLNLLFQEKKILSLLNKNKSNKSKLKENPYIKSRKIEPDLISSLYKIHSTELNKTEGGPLFGNGKDKPQTGYCGETTVIDETVEVPINFLTKIIKGVAITRIPFTSASIFPMLAIASYYAGLGDGLFSTLNLILAVFGVLMLHLSSNVFNDYFDVSDGTDEANNEYFQPGGAAITGGSRAIELGIITLEKTKTVATLLLTTSLIIAGGLFYNIYTTTGSLYNVYGAFLIGLTGLFLGYFYTGRPLRLVARRGLGELAIFLAFGPMLTLGTGYAISVETITLYSPEFYMLLSLGVPFGLLTTNILFINQFPDAESDAQTGKNHLVVTLGKKASRWGYLLILSLAFYSSVYLTSLLDVHQYFSSQFFIIGNSVLYLFGLYIFSNLYRNYEKRELVNSNINTIVLQSLFSIFYILSLNLFFI